MRYIVSFILLFGFWILLSGKLDVFHLSLGLVSAFLVTVWSGDLLFRKKDYTAYQRIRFAWRFFLYLFWLCYQIVIANLHIMYLILHPKMKELINPKIVRFNSLIKDDFGKFLLANSITLTPGTITICIEGDEFVVHAIDDVGAKGLMAMEKHVERLYE